MVIRTASDEARTLQASGFRIKNEEGEDMENDLLSRFTEDVVWRLPKIVGDIPLMNRLTKTMLLRRKLILYRRHRQWGVSSESQRSIPEPTVESQPAPTPDLSSGPIKHPTTSIEEPSATPNVQTLRPERSSPASSGLPHVVMGRRAVPSTSYQPFNFPPAPGAAARRKYEEIKSQESARIRDKMSKEDALEPDIEQRIQEAIRLRLCEITEVTCPYC